MIDTNSIYGEFKEEDAFKKTIRAQEKLQRNEPDVVQSVREGIKNGFVCNYCGAKNRADVFYRADLSEDREVVVEIVCRAFVDGVKCGNVETRYY